MEDCQFGDDNSGDMMTDTDVDREGFHSGDRGVGDSVAHLHHSEDSENSDDSEVHLHNSRDSEIQLHHSEDSED
jgi:hypothetical protein